MHAVNCTGRIEIADGVFRNQFDDAINIHGIYAPVVSRPSASEVVAELRHETQKGILFAEPGNRIRFLDRKRMLPVGELCCLYQKFISPGFFQLGLDGAVPDGTDLILENIDWIPESVEIRNCDMRDNNPRGILASSGRKIMISGNRISAPFCGVQIAGDANFWFESGAVSDVRICNNLFQEVNYLEEKPDCGAITVNPQIEVPDGQHFFHGTLTVENNEFRSCNGGLVNAESLSRLVWKHNVVDCPGALAASVRNCGQIEFYNNINRDIRQRTESDSPADGNHADQPL